MLLKDLCDISRKYTQFRIFELDLANNLLDVRQFRVDEIKESLLNVEIISIGGEYFCIEVTIPYAGGLFTKG